MARSNAAVRGDPVRRRRAVRVFVCALLVFAFASQLRLRQF
jgi:hypothetical protein